MRAAKVQASLRIRAVSPEPSLLAHRSSESRGTFRQKARSLAPLNGWACAVKMCHDGMLEDTNSLDGAHMIMCVIVCLFQTSVIFDIHLDGESDGYVTHHYPVVSPLPIKPFRLLLPTLNIQSGQEKMEYTCELYSANWIVFQPNVVIDAKLGQRLLPNEQPHDKTNKMACAPSEDSSQPGHLPSLIRVFTVRTIDN